MTERRSDIDSVAYEEKHVHEVYQVIAPHFSSTRYKPWPIVDQFLRRQSPGSIGLDVGCGNGKYLTANPDIFIIASDRSQPLVDIAKQHQPNSCILADTLQLPHQDSLFDFVISIAVIHHLSSPARRIEALKALLRLVKPTVDYASGGRVLIFVWALEQKDSRRGWDVGDSQDVMVPWVLQANSAKDQEKKLDEQVFHRYYHLYRSGELERDILTAGGLVLDSGYEKDNWWAIAGKNGSF